jgi:predicted PurR-regulated permease PerM
MTDWFKRLPPWMRLGLIFPLAFLNGWLFFQLIKQLEPLFSIFVTATLLAFLLDIPIRLLQTRGIKRGWSIALVFLLALLLLVILGLVLIPLIVQQLSELVNILPQWIESGSQQLRDLKQWAIAQTLPIDLRQVITQATDKISSLLQSLSSQLLNFLLGAIGSITNILFVLVLTVFLVFSGEKVWDGLCNWLPSPWDERLPESMGKTFETYFATQAALAGILSLAQTLVLIFLQVPYAILFGVAIGMTTLIPFASALTIIVVSLLLCLQNFWLGIKVLIATIIIGQINDQFVAPRLMGGMIGLNPVWIVIALFIGGKLAGILGLLIAVPIASVIKSTADALRSSPAQPHDNL